MDTWDNEKLGEKLNKLADIEVESFEPLDAVLVAIDNDNKALRKMFRNVEKKRRKVILQK